MSALPVQVWAERLPGELEIIGDFERTIIPLSKHGRQHIAHQFNADWPRSGKNAVMYTVCRTFGWSANSVITIPL